MATLSCTSVVPAGAQTWNKDVGDSSGTLYVPLPRPAILLVRLLCLCCLTFVFCSDCASHSAMYCSTLAAYIYDIASMPRLEKILTASDRTILAVAWSRHDPNTIAMAIAEQEHNILLWDIASETVTRRIGAIAQPAKYIAW